VKNGSETDVDCGGACMADCANGKVCMVGTDCQSAVCTGGLCTPSACNDGLHNGNETDVDCGGPMCAQCSDGKACMQAGDCQSGKCSGGLCQAPSCNDGVKNGGETDVDCGGACAADCATGKSCMLNGDCLSNLCQGGVCVAPTCMDAVKNGSETDVDCGGLLCPKCAPGKACAQGSDCQALICMASVCAAPTCVDSVKNGGETDIDCGGPTCTKCGSGGACSAGSDCASGVCMGGSCQAPSCSDGVKNGSETGVDCGGASCAICPVVLVLGGGNVAGVLTGELHPGGSWVSTLLGDATTFGPSLAITTTGTAYGLIRSEASHELRFTTWNSGAWTPFAAVGAGVTTREQPSIRAAGAAAHAVFHGDDFKYYHALFTGAAIPQPEAVGAGAGQSFGPSPAVIVASPTFPAGATASVAFINGAAQNHVFSRDRGAASWNAEAQIDGGNTNFNLAPDLIRLSAGPELMAVWARTGDNQVLYATRSGGVWSAAGLVPNTFSNDRVSVAELPGGAAILAFRGTDGFLYYAHYANGVWSAAAPFSTPNVAITASPAIAHGVGAGATQATAELAFTMADGKVYASRLLGGVWAAPLLVGGANMNRVAIASAP
jgi:hypothetical protein